MMVGKRPRPPMKRTTSMKEITFDVDPNNGSEQAPPSDPFGFRSLSTVLPRTGRNRRHSADFLETPDHFLRACFLCKRRLFPGRDIYMYRGDSAFCSLECRQQQMKKDDKKDKCSVASSRKESGVAASSATSSVGPPLSINGETVAAAAS